MDTVLDISLPKILTPYRHRLLQVVDWQVPASHLQLDCGGTFGGTHGPTGTSSLQSSGVGSSDPLTLSAGVSGCLLHQRHDRLRHRGLRRPSGVLHQTARLLLLLHLHPQDGKHTHGRRSRGRFDSTVHNLKLFSSLCLCSSAAAVTSCVNGCCVVLVTWRRGQTPRSNWRSD